MKNPSITPGLLGKHIFVFYKESKGIAEIRIKYWIGMFSHKYDIGTRVSMCRYVFYRKNTNTVIL